MTLRHFAFVALCLMLTAQTGQAITIDTVPIGNPGNPGDTRDTGDHQTGFGSVAYNYRIGKYDVTVGQYTAFLNAVAATDTHGLYNPSMATDLNSAGIARSGSSGSYSYSVIGSPNHPITYVSFWDAARFANWLNNGQPTGAQGPNTTEGGAYIHVDNQTTFARQPGARVFIPTEDEWYKAAFYDPAAGHYWTYPTGTNTPPTSAPPGSTPNTANVYDKITGYAVTGSTSLDSSQNYLTDVGAYSASASPYGTFDQAGNVGEWNETRIEVSYQGERGSDWRNAVEFASFDGRIINEWPTNESNNLGFRVATVQVSSDFNGNGIVDAADYTVWRDTLGRYVPIGTGGDANLNGMIDPGDYAVWAMHFGQNSASGAGSAAVPEPSGLILILSTVVVLTPNVARFARPRG
jgi:sulfatase modifying factor 1